MFEQARERIGFCPYITIAIKNKYSPITVYLELWSFRLICHLHAGVISVRSCFCYNFVLLDIENRVAFSPHYCLYISGFTRWDWIWYRYSVKYILHILQIRTNVEKCKLLLLKLSSFQYKLLLLKLSSFQYKLLLIKLSLFQYKLLLLKLSSFQYKLLLLKLSSFSI